MLTAKERSLSQLVRILFVVFVGVSPVGANSLLIGESDGSNPSEYWTRQPPAIWRTADITTVTVYQRATFLRMPCNSRGIPGGIRAISAQGV